MKIFVSIASYRDPLLYNTIMEAYKNAKNKSSIIFGVVDQSYPFESLDLDSIPFRKQIRYTRINPYYTRGACWARHLAQTLYVSEEYYFQIDSHMLFDPDWDQILIDQYEELKQYHKKPVITTYPPAFEIIDGNISNLKKGENETLLALKVHKEGSFEHNEMYENYAISVNSKHLSTKDPVHGFLVAAGCLFASGDIVEEVPYDPYLFFIGEEQSLALRLFSHGYNIFHTYNIPIYHNYNRTYGKSIWSDADTEEQKQMKWHQLDFLSKLRLRDVCQGKTGVYGLGTERTLNQYISLTGIDYYSRMILPKAETGEHIFSVPYQNSLL